MVDKADGFELLFGYPVEYPEQTSHYDLPYTKGWYAGWDECFPAVGASKYVGRPYDGIPVPDHGEIWSLPTTAVPTRDGITTVWHGLRFGYRLTRKLYLEGASIVAEYTLINLAPFDFHFVWAQHPILRIAKPAQIMLAKDAGTSFRFSHVSGAVPVDQPFEWPRLPEGLDLSQPSNLPAGQTWKVYSNDPISSPLTIMSFTGSGVLNSENCSTAKPPAVALRSNW